jgi:glycosyltransferase involved in cell wall biosynthesis
MPVHNGARFLRPAIDSILAQSFRDLELFVIDDDSSDDSVTIARSYGDPRLRIFSGHGRHGLPGTLNIGLRAASGEFIARLDQDDVAHADRVEKQLAWLERRPDVALVGSLARLIDESGRPSGTVRRPTSEIGVRWYSLVENPLIHSTAMFRRDPVLALGGYDDSLPLAEDYDLWGRILKTHAAENMPEYLIDYRRVSSSMMTTVESEAAGPKQKQLQEIMARLIAKRLHDELGSASAEDALLLSRFTFGVDGAELSAFLDVLTRLRGGFESKWRQAANDRDYWRTLAWQYDAIAFRLRPPSRRGALRVYMHACTATPRAAGHLSWTRAMALLVLGKSGRQRASGMAKAS